MATRAITRPIEAVRRDLDTQRLRAALAAPPDPDAWIAFLCDRCERPFKVKGIARHCPPCIHGAAARGITGSETIGQASGA